MEGRGVIVLMKMNVLALIQFMHMKSLVLEL